MKRVALAASVGVALAAASVAPAATTLSGTYRTTITSTALRGEVKGPWTVKFSGGVITAAKNGTVATRGNYSISGSRITLRATPGQDRCTVVSVYKFTLSGARLRFTLISGTGSSPSCEARQIVLAGSFTKVG
jgi:hypothetical protein